MTALDSRAVIALVHRLSRNDARARARIGRLLELTDSEVALVLELAHRRVTSDALETLLSASPGGAGALIRQLEGKALLRHEPDAFEPHRTLLGVTEAGERELTAAYGPLTDRLEALAGGFSPEEMDAIARYLVGLETCY
jgi:DNA-binding MarR family transcriptional regulator